MELDTLLEVALVAGYLSQQELQAPLSLIDRVGRMLTRLAQAISDSAT